ncbi:ABC transporter permease [Clostridium thermarum]|uniref:ABC transporter permease n=1 Tax=Clostridium thermarum TaxID=1716543 RepID=UPI00112487D0|nr:ABC transporter permease [Clostridium thermarum]
MRKIRNSKIVSFFRNSPKTTIGALLIIIMLVLTLGAGIFTSHDPTHRYVGEYHSPPSSTHILGTTRLGNDVFAQTLYGGRKSITVGIAAGAITVALGLFFGISSGYFGGVYDNVITTIINILMVIPNIVLLLIITSLLGGVSPVVICLIIGFTSWPWNARVLRAQTMSIRNREFIYSAETLGESKLRIMFVEIMPNMLSMISSAFVSTLIYAIMAQATLEFIGFGDPLSVTWGTMLYNAQKSGALTAGIWWELLGPISGIVLFGAGLTLINFSIDEISNPKLRAQRIMRAYYRVVKKQRRLKGKNSDQIKIQEGKSM